MEQILKGITLALLLVIFLQANEPSGIDRNIETNSSFNRILKDVATSHEYIPNVYDCTEFSL